VAQRVDQRDIAAAVTAQPLLDVYREALRERLGG
jgi:hypothetical protein